MRYANWFLCFLNDRKVFYPVQFAFWLLSLAFFCNINHSPTLHCLYSQCFTGDIKYLSIYLLNYLHSILFFFCFCRLVFENVYISCILVTQFQPHINRLALSSLHRHLYSTYVYINVILIAYQGQMKYSLYVFLKKKCDFSKIFNVDNCDSVCLESIW